MALVQSVEQVVGEQGDESEGDAKTLFSISFNPNALLQPHVVSEASCGSQDYWWCTRRAWTVKGLDQEETMNTMSYKATGPVCRRCKFYWNCKRFFKKY